MSAPRVSDERLAAALAHAARAVITGEYAEEEMEARLIRDICADLRDAREEVARLKALLARSRAALELVVASAPEIHGDGRKPERSWGASLSLAPIRDVLADLDAALGDPR